MNSLLIFILGVYVGGVVASFFLNYGDPAIASSRGLEVVVTLSGSLTWPLLLSWAVLADIKMTFQRRGGGNG